MTANDLMLIFKNADNDTAMLPLSTLHQIDGGSGSIVLTFGGADTGDDLVDTDVDVITLTTGADEMEACKELVIADDVAGTYCSSTITGVAIA